MPSLPPSSVFHSVSSSDCSLNYSASYFIQAVTFTHWETDWWLMSRLFRLLVVIPAVVLDWCQCHAIVKTDVKTWYAWHRADCYGLVVLWLMPWSASLVTDVDVVSLPWLMSRLRTCLVSSRMLLLVSWLMTDSVLCVISEWCQWLMPLVITLSLV